MRNSKLHKPDEPDEPEHSDVKLVTDPTLIETKID